MRVDSCLQSNIFSPARKSDVPNVATRKDRVPSFQLFPHQGFDLPRPLVELAGRMSWVALETSARMNAEAWKRARKDDARVGTELSCHD